MSSCFYVLKFSLSNGKMANDINNKRTLNILQGLLKASVTKKKALLTHHLHKNKKIDVACIQKTHLNAHQRFSVRAYQTICSTVKGIREVF